MMFVGCVVFGAAGLDVKLEKGTVMGVSDSSRYYLLILGAVNVGIGFYTRDVSEQFRKVILASTKEDALPVASDGKSHSHSHSHLRSHGSKAKKSASQTEISVKNSGDEMGPPLTPRKGEEGEEEPSLSSPQSASASKPEDDKSAASDESSIHGEVPEIRVENCQFRSRRALSRATPSKKILDL